MDASIRVRTAAGGPLKIAPPARPVNMILTSGNVNAIPTQPEGRRFTNLTGPATIASLRKAILDCAHQATAAEPVDTDRRLHSFIAKLSGTMEGLGERELDAALWNLMETKPAACQVAP